MSIQIDRIELEADSLRVQALLFLPSPDCTTKSLCSIYTHGYTDHKGSLFNWGVHCAERSIPSLIFDLPGHYLGNYNELDSFENFENSTSKLFHEGLKKINSALKGPAIKEIILGGHSLGALMALRSGTLPELGNIKKNFLAVGLGLDPIDRKHLFETKLYRRVLEARIQLISPHLHPDRMFPWTKDERANFQLEGQQIHFITGENDMVTAADGTQRLIELLIARGNRVTFDRPKNLPHHHPEMAVGLISSYIRNNFS